MPSTSPIAVGIAALFLSGCATTIVSTDTTAPVVTVATTTTLPSGDSLQLMKNIAAAGADLGNAIANGRGDEARDALATAKANWIVLEPQLQQLKLDLVEDLRRIVDMMTTAVERKRPADADKANRFLGLVIDAYSQL
ncbi:MAG: 5-bromo-4-chloroindolyl phosphate hydrolysis family protein [Ilumatobacteraceae bacterium]|jgi:hypothetical protein|nr:5-bromo-4-chloroindolyl phosphate hydrolysis family protein [Ilumatobacteraceae bacterium]